MILGRIFGVFVAAALAATIRSDSPIIEAALIFGFVIVGVIASIGASLLFGPNISNDEPHWQDSEDYWVNKLGEPLGKDAYKLWLEDVNQTDDGV